MGGNGVSVVQVEAFVLELVEMGVCVLVGVLVTNGNPDGVAMGEDASEGNAEGDDNTTSALICAGEQAIRKTSKITIINLFKLRSPAESAMKILCIRH